MRLGDYTRICVAGRHDADYSLGSDQEEDSPVEGAAVASLNPDHVDGTS